MKPHPTPRSTRAPGSTVSPGKKSAIIIAGLCGVGLLSGFAARRISAPNPAAAKAGGVSEAADGAGKISASSAAASRRSPRDRAKTAAATLPHHKSADTLETLLALKDDELYTRLAGWLSDASEPDIAAFWTSYGPRKGRSNDITDLVFLNWARLDPQAAIAGSSSDQHAWWAWACHDPAAALAEALAHSPEHSHHVAWGIGEFHPEWLRAHYNELNEKDQSHALQGMAKWSDGQNPLAAMEFFKEIGREVDKGTFKALIRQDPWAALDWIKEHPGRNGPGTLGYSVNDPMQLVVDTMAAERPDDLERLAAQTPSGSLKLKMENALFTSLLESDPEAALARAKETKAPQIAVQRFAAIGLAAVKSDPEQAFAMAGEMFAANPNALQMMTMVEFPGGGSGSSISLPEVQNLFAALMKQDPERTLQMAAAVKGSGFAYFSSPLSSLASQWAENDFTSFTGWVNRQTDPAIRSQGAGVVINKLQQEGNYAESAEWMMSQPEDNQTPYSIANMLQNWRRSDPAAADAWLEDADLPEDGRAKIQKILDNNR